MPGTWHLLVAAAVVFSGCASGPRIIPYAPVEGKPNLTISRAADPGLLEFSRSSLWIFQDQGGCRRQYLGTYDLKRGENSVHLPPGFEYFLEMVNQTGGPFSQGSVNRPWVRIFMGPKESFDLEYAERDGSVSFRVFRTSVKGARERFPGLPELPCEEIDLRWKRPAASAK